MVKEPGKYTVEPRDTEDFNLYKKSLLALKERLSKTLKVNSYFIVQSRKGPRLFEFLFNENERTKYNVLTEHALPFLFDTLSKEPDKQYHFYVIDDAIYFGTTIENLVAEINTYIRMYGLKTEGPEVFTIIKSQEAKRLEDIKLYANTEIRKGYGHYFINLLMTDLMSLGNTMEVEFPIITCKFDKPVNQKDFYNQFDTLYNGNSTIYVIPEYTSSLIPRDEVLRFSIIFDESDALFCKIRVYVKGDIARMAIMMPYNLVDNSSVLEQLFNDEDNNIRSLWKSVSDVINDSTLNIPYQGSIIRSRQRTLIILANYLLSLKLYYRECEKIEKVLGKYTGDNINRPALDRTGLKYLLGEDKLVDMFLEVFEYYQLRPSQFLGKMDTLRSNPSTSQIFEVPGYPGDEEKRKLQDFNSRMVIHSHNAYEALSALFFNQTVLVEQWYRSFDYTSNYRLKFGYNFQGLYKTLTEIKRSETPELKLDMSLLHAWIDNRVDRGCVVPQYIIDHNRNHWDRVFRPGENEDALTSTLTRFVAFVLQSIKRVFRERYVPELILKKMLSIVCVGVQPNLSDILQLYLTPSVNGLFFADIFEKEKDRVERDVIEYLKDMYVLTVDGNTVEMSKRFYNTEQTSNTTFSSNIGDEIVHVLEDIYSETTRNKIPLYRSYGICNKRLIATYLMHEERKTLKNCSIQTIGAIIDIRDGKKEENVLLQLRNAYNLLNSYILPDNYYVKDSDNHINKYQSYFLQIDFYINLLVLVYFAPRTVKLPVSLRILRERYNAIEEIKSLSELIDTVLTEYEISESSNKVYRMSRGLLEKLLKNVQDIRDKV